MRVISALLTCLVAGTAFASPSISLDHPIYEQIARLQALGHVPQFLGGLRPLSASQLRRIRIGDPTDADLSFQPRGWWVSPTRLVRADTAVVSDGARPYSTVLRPRDLTGSLALSCERVEGRICRHGSRFQFELESAAGYRDWISAVTRFRTGLHGEGDASLVADRAYLRSEFGPIALQVGRDAFALGPASRTQLAWGTNAPPLDHARVGTAYPLALGSLVLIDAHYILGRLRGPQTYPGTLVSIVRGQMDVAGSIDVGVVQILQLGGAGARSFDVVEFLVEHVWRADSSASVMDSSNRRFGFDISTRILELEGLRLYYALMFEDIRKARWMDAVRYDADHLIGMELAAVGPGRRHGLTVEWHKTGVRSHEHSPRTIGFTHGGYVVGSPLGPDAQSLYFGGRINLGVTMLYPWIELAQLKSDTYEFIVDGSINRISIGEDEVRYRAGTRVRVPIKSNLWIQGEAMFEHVEDFAFESGATRNHGGVTASIIWYPGVASVGSP